MIDFVVDYCVSIGLITISFAMFIFLYLNNKKPKTKAPPLTKKPPKHFHFKQLPDRFKKGIEWLEMPGRLFKLAASIIAVLFSFCGAQASVTIKDIYTRQDAICGTIKTSEKCLNKCVEDNSKTIINKLNNLLRMQEPNNVK